MGGFAPCTLGVSHCGKDCCEMQRHYRYLWSEAIFKSSQYHGDWPREFPTNGLAIGNVHWIQYWLICSMSGWWLPNVLFLDCASSGRSCGSFGRVKERLGGRQSTGRSVRSTIEGEGG